MGTPHPAAFDKDLYELLQVSPRAEPEVINAAHKALMKQYAPRQSGDNGELARDLNEAKQILIKKPDRRRYDEYRNGERKLIGPYRLLSQVGQGGFGTTYKAEHTLLGEYSCIKHCLEISAQAEMILRQETKSIWNLAHFGLPVMRDFLQLDDGSFALAMGWIEGPTLHEVIEKHGRLDAENVAWITERILNTLLYLHHHGVIHADIKPQNIIVQEDTHIVVLVDFGLAIIKPTSSTKSKGYTDLFSPPEQMAAKTLVPGSDFYSLGKTMLYALGGGYEAVERVEVPADLPDPMCDFIKSLIVRDVVSRPRDTDALFEQFKKMRWESFGREHSDMKKFEV